MERIKQKAKAKMTPIIASIIFTTLLSFILYSHLEWRSITQTIPPDNKVLVTPYYTAIELLEKSGYQVNTYSGDMLPDEASLLVFNSNSLKNRNQLYLLKEWVERGGHLVVGISTDSKYENPIFSLFNITLQKSSKECTIFWTSVACMVKVAISPHNYLLTLTEIVSASLPTTKIWYVSNPQAQRQGQLLSARFRYGKGYVTFIQKGWFTNSEIVRYDHAKFLIEATTLKNSDRPLYIIEEHIYRQILPWLFQNYPYPIFSLLIFVFFLLWCYMPRFGGIHSIPVIRESRLMQHLSAVGHFHVTHNNFTPLLAPIRRKLIHLIEPFHLHYPSIDSQTELISTVTGVDSNKVDSLLNAKIAQRSEFIECVKSIATIIKQIESLKHSDEQVKKS